MSVLILATLWTLAIIVILLMFSRIPKSEEQRKLEDEEQMQFIIEWNKNHPRKK